MKTLLSVTALVLMSSSLAACGKSGDEKLASNVEQAADNRADQMEAMADNLEARAKETREVGEQRADAIKAADLNTQAMSEQHKEAIIANQAAAVR